MTLRLWAGMLGVVTVLLLAETPGIRFHRHYRSGGTDCSQHIRREDQERFHSRKYRHGSRHLRL
jgi:hypothetical protein